MDFAPIVLSIVSCHAAGKTLGIANSKPIKTDARIAIV